LNDAELERRIELVWGEFRESGADVEREIARLKQLYWAGGSQPGDASRGRSVYVRTCQQCHVLFGVGGKVGPDITGSNRSDLDYLLQTILDPNAVIPNEYRASNLETMDGRVLTGIVQRQDDRSVTILTADEELVIPRDEIEVLEESELSMMPEALLDQLEEQELRDLIYYLTRPGQAPLVASVDTLGPLFNGRDLSGWHGDPDLWRVEDNEVVGRALKGLERNEFLVHDVLFSDFRLVCQVRLTPNSGNSGIQFRSRRQGEHEMRGYQADIGAGWWGKLYEEHGRGLLWDRPGDVHVRPEDWNTYEIVAVGSRVLTAINGQRCVDLEDAAGATAGILGLQLHAGAPMEVRFKNFEVELDPEPVLKTLR
jgi:putative heme-binding domain-containing protein